MYLHPGHLHPSLTEPPSWPLSRRAAPGRRVVPPSGPRTDLSWDAIQGHMIRAHRLRSEYAADLARRAAARVAWLVRAAIAARPAPRARSHPDAALC